MDYIRKYKDGLKSYEDIPVSNLAVNGENITITILSDDLDKLSVDLYNSKCNVYKDGNLVAILDNNFTIQKNYYNTADDRKKDEPYTLILHIRIINDIEKSIEDYDDVDNVDDFLDGFVDEL